MDAASQLKEVLATGRAARLVEDGIYSALTAPGDSPAGHRYDRRAGVYDLVVGTRLYNALMWGNSPLDYAAFARLAVESDPAGTLLDAACGSMLFTAPVYLECKSRRIIAFDQSLAMLRRARKRLIKLSGSVPGNVLLVQADLSDLPFRSGAFRTILCMNVLHHYENAATLIPRLKGLLSPGGRLYLTSLVSNRRFIGDRYLDLLHSSGEFVGPRSGPHLEGLLRDAFGEKLDCLVKGNMAYATTYTDASV